VRHGPGVDPATLKIHQDMAWQTGRDWNPMSRLGGALNPFNAGNPLNPLINRALGLPTATGPAAPRFGGRGYEFNMEDFKHRQMTESTLARAQELRQKGDIVGANRLELQAQQYRLQADQYALIANDPNQRNLRGDNYIAADRPLTPEQASEVRPPSRRQPENQSSPPLESRVVESNSRYRSTPEIRQEFREFFGEKRYVEYAREIESLRLKHPELKNIPTADLVAVRGYTSSDYAILNKALRSGDPAELARLNAYIRSVESGLSQLPSYQGTVFRGTNLSSEIASKYQPGRTITEDFFFSTAAEPGSAFPGNTQYTVSSTHGRRIDFFSEYPHEKEVLFPPNTNFKVHNVEIDKVIGSRKITMEEVPE
jgi:ADP-ribosyltransferase exoenzyme